MFRSSMAVLALFFMNLSSTTAQGSDTAMILNGGSTNTMPYSVSVHRDGRATITSGRDRRTVRIRGALSRRLFSALQALRHARTTEAVPCMKSASFGATLKVRWMGWSSVDLECPLTGPNRTLRNAVHDVLGALRVTR